MYPYGRRYQYYYDLWLVDSVMPAMTPGVATALRCVCHASVFVLAGWS